MDELKDSIIEMNNLEIKENILLINKRQLENIKKASYFNVFHSILGVQQLLEGKVEAKDSSLIKETDLFNNYLKESINSVILSMNRIDRENQELENLKGRREELYEIYSILEGYLISISHIGEFIDEYGIKLLAKRDYSNKHYDDIKIEELIVKINKILNENKDNYKVYIYIISEIIAMLPMRLTKENYYSIVRNTLIRNLSTHTKSEVEIQIDNYKKQFESSSRDGYGTKFDYYFTEIQKLKNIDLKDQDLQGLSNLVNKNTKLTKGINELINCNIILGLITNMNIIITLTDNIPVDSKVEKAYKEWKELLKNKDENKLEKFKSTIQDELVNIEKDIFRDLENFQNLNMEGINREDFNYDELNEELFYTTKILTYYDDSQFTNPNLMFSGDEESPSPEYIQQAVDSLVQYINRSINNMDNFQRRIRMRKILSIIELPFVNINDFTNYIKYSLDSRIIEKEEISFKIDHINYFLNEFL